MNVLPGPKVGRVTAGSVFIHDRVATVELFLRNNGRVIIFPDDPFAFRLQWAAAGLTQIIPIRPDIKRVSDNITDQLRSPLAATLRRDLIVVQIPGDLRCGTNPFVFVENKLDDLRFFWIRFREFDFRVPAIADRHTCAVPQALFRAIQHDSGYTFGSHVPFKFSENQNDFQHSFADGGRSVELFIHRNKSDLVVFQFLIHRREVQKISGYAIHLPDDQVGKFPVPDTRHHFLKMRPIGILRRISVVFKNHKTFNP